jgi:3-oxoacyl-[acyl-carrier-protein] synthase-3
MIRAFISAIAYYLPEQVLTNEDLAREFPRWGADRIFEKTGILRRHRAAPGETSVDMAVKAAERLFEARSITRNQIDFVILCTQSPDFLLPASSCIVQERLGLPTSSGGFDMNLGCSGFIYGLATAKGLIETESAGNVLLLTSDTYTKLLRETDASARSIFSDGAAATLISATTADRGTPPLIGPFCFGTDGSGADHLIVRSGGFRNPNSPSQGRPFLEMDGPGIFTFGLKRVPAAVTELLRRSQIAPSEIRLYIFHQASQIMLETLRKCLRIAPERYFMNISRHGNTISSTIPIALADAHAQGLTQPMDVILLAGFGVGLSWATTLVKLPRSLK